jgi:hypothetical protein
MSWSWGWLPPRSLHLQLSRRILFHIPSISTVIASASSRSELRHRRGGLPQERVAEPLELSSRSVRLFSSPHHWISSYPAFSRWRGSKGAPGAEEGMGIRRSTGGWRACDHGRHLVEVWRRAEVVRLASPQPWLSLTHWGEGWVLCGGWEREAPLSELRPAIRTQPLAVPAMEQVRGRHTGGGGGGAREDMLGYGGTERRAAAL